MTPEQVTALAAELRGRLRDECRTPAEVLAVLELVTAPALAVALNRGTDRQDVERWASGVLRRLRRIRAAMAGTAALQ